MLEDFVHRQSEKGWFLSKCDNWYYTNIQPMEATWTTLLDVHWSCTLDIALNNDLLLPFAGQTEDGKQLNDEVPPAITEIVPSRIDS